MSEQSWQTPPAPIHQILTAPPTPTVSFSPTQQWFLELERPSLCSIVDLAAPEVAVAGFRLNPQTNSPARSNPYRQLWITELATGIKRGVPLPNPVQISFLRWSPDGQKLAFTLTQSNGLELWAMELAAGKPWRVTEPILNGTYGSPYCWQSNEAFLCKVIVPDRGDPPIAPQVQPPRIQENLGRKTPSLTYTNLLSSPYDETLFEYYVTSTLEQINLAGQRTSLVASALISSVVPSPDGQYILLETLHRPFSYQVPASRFPKCIQILDQRGSLIHQLADLPLDDQRSTKFDAVRPGARAIRWRSDLPASLFWVEALDGGDPTQAVPQRDRGLELNAPFTEPPQELWRSQYRFRRIRWGRDNVALLWERDYDTRQLRLWRIHPDQPQTPPTLLIDRSFEDRYRDPGMPLMTPGAYGCHVLRFSSDGQSIYFSGRGASPQGVYPFLDRMELVTGQTERIWQCQAPYFEGVVDLLKDMTLITRRQSKTEPPNYFKRSLGQDQLLPLTHYADPAPQFAGVQKEVVRYQRADGVALSAKLYLPAGYDPQKDGALPMLFWIYPEEFKNRELAGQVTVTENEFSRPRYASVLFLLTQGYAILDNPTLPIIGEETIEPNDTYVEQLIAGAEAAVSYVVERGVADRDRLGIGGHSYGAFTTANLLAHTSLFRLGIARSGAYNRTLTPFGFQGEQRHFWEASTTYMQMSPFTHAATITAPLLLIHGASDSNVGTYPLQTERLYEALKGLGATVRWVELPLEDHSYRSQESVGHVLWEMVRWCDRYLKGLQEH
ncbi:MAG: prolyl oligopeptidase family serine peptidase [Drouetiella hepatica Uher 2000/2452]|jgi:dipeptidyl aminopeptidase/acylaminoacyl peptidase|uniref:Prolyl oligopeptidase family serine peptidase n=1 Tax=Drouetiella hepatica Uher 2000/2452 TaxID=904376 RepID=A0A951UPL0_9CYAN|nr:prolyl oligopeptidase family serine peptidase [Drouetiella hepatica Uher 2000/2452]